MGIIDDIKQDAKKSGAGKGKFMYFKAGSKARIRFLQELDDGHKVTFHDSYTDGINVPCQETFGRECKYCDNDDLRHRVMYAWSVWDYEAKEVKILMYAVNQCSPVPSLLAMDEAYGTIMDRDYVLTKTGEGTSTTFAVIPQDKAKFRNQKAKAFSESKFLSLLDKGFPDDDADDDEDETPRSRKRKSSTTSAKKRKPVQDDYDDDDEEDYDDDWDDDEDDDEEDYDSMTAKELYDLCTERGIKVKPRKQKDFYISKLEEADGEDDEEDDDDWD